MTSSICPAKLAISKAPKHCGDEAVALDIVADRAEFDSGVHFSVHWPDVDEDISIDGMLHGTPAPRPMAVL